MEKDAAMGSRNVRCIVRENGLGREEPGAKRDSPSRTWCAHGGAPLWTIGGRTFAQRAWVDANTRIGQANRPPHREPHDLAELRRWLPNPLLLRLRFMCTHMLHAIRAEGREAFGHAYAARETVWSRKAADNTLLHFIRTQDGNGSEEVDGICSHRRGWVANKRAGRA
jgi:hypothetical protein